MSSTEIEINVTEIAANAPLPQSFYDQFPPVVLDAIEAAWPNAGGYVCILTSKDMPGCITIQQTVDVGLLESRLQRSEKHGPQLAIARAMQFPDRVTACEEVRRELRSCFETRLEPAGKSE
jgi:hypothetical protein